MSYVRTPPTSDSPQLKRFFRETMPSALEQVAGEPDLFVGYDDNPDTVVLDGNEYRFSSDSSDLNPVKGRGVSKFTRCWKLESVDKTQPWLGQGKPNIEVSLSFDGTSSRQGYNLDAEVAYVNRVTGEEHRESFQHRPKPGISATPSWKLDSLLLRAKTFDGLSPTFLLAKTSFETLEQLALTQARPEDPPPKL